MEILLWLVPPAVVTVIAMAWVGWIGRAGRGQVDRDEAVRRLGVALEKDHVVPEGAPRRPREPATGVAVRRPTEVVEPFVEPVVEPVAEPVLEPVLGPEDERDEERRAS